MGIIRDSQWLSTLSLVVLAGSFQSRCIAEIAPHGSGAKAEEGESEVIQEIVVTAQRRSESLQKTSVVVDVVQPGELSRAGIQQAQDLTKVMPGVQISQIGPGPEVYIRGVGDFGSTAVSESAVPFNIDGVYIGRSASVASEFYDFDRVEVLKGPQGTLYGRNASGGAVNVLTRNPVLDETGGDLDAEVGNFAEVAASGGINLPLASTFAIRASGQVVRKDGYTRDGDGDDKHEAGRLKVLWKPIDDFSMLVSGSYGHVGGRGPAFVILNTYPGNGAWVDAASGAGRAFITSTIARYGLTGLVSPPPSASDEFQDERFWNLSAQMTWNLHWADLLVQPAYRDTSIRAEQVHSFPYQVGGGAAQLPPRPETSGETSLETRLSGGNSALKWVIGAYFYDERQYSQYTVNFGLIQSQVLKDDLGTRSYSLFGQSTYSITSGLRVIAGLRGTSDRRDLENGEKYSVNPALSGGCLPPNPSATCLLETYEGSKTFHNLSWKTGMEYDLTDDNMLYLTASTGFKAGGYNEQLDISAQGTSGPAAGYSPEKLYAYELGIKNRFLDNRLQANFEFFYWDYVDHQEGVIAFSGAGNTNFSFVNAGDARMYGGSADLAAKPWQGGTLRTSFEYNSSKYKSFNTQTPLAFIVPGVSTACKVTDTGRTTQVGPLANVDCSGFQVNRAPTWSGSAGYSHAFDLPSGGKLIVDTDVDFASSRWISTDFIAQERAPAYQVVNASFGYQAAAERWHLTAYVRNATSAKVYTGGFIAPFLAPLVLATIQAPRTYGVRAGMSF